MKNLKIFEDLKNLFKPTVDFFKRSNAIIGVIIPLLAVVTLIIPVTLLVITLGIGFIQDLFGGYLTLDNLDAFAYEVGYYYLSNSILSVVMCIFMVFWALIVMFFSTFICTYTTLNILNGVRQGQIEKMTVSNFFSNMFRTSNGFISIWQFIGKYLLYGTLPTLVINLLISLISLIPGVTLDTSSFMPLINVIITYNVIVRCFASNKYEAKSFMNEHYLVPLVIGLFASLLNEVIFLDIVTVVSTVLLACYVINNVMCETENTSMEEKEVVEEKEVMVEKTEETVQQVAKEEQKLTTEENTFDSVIETDLNIMD